MDEIESYTYAMTTQLSSVRSCYYNVEVVEVEKRVLSIGVQDPHGLKSRAFRRIAAFVGNLFALNKSVNKN